MVVLVAFLQSAQYGDGTHLVGLVDHHCLEAALQCLVFLEILLILVERRGTNGSQFATCQCRFQNVGGIHGSLAAASTDECVYLVYEKNDAPVGLSHFVDNTLQPFLKLAFILCTGHQCTHVERVELFVLQVLGHVATHNPACQSLDDGCLAGTWLANEYGVVLSAPRQYLQHTAYLVVATYHGVEFSLPCQVNQVLGILVQRLVVVVGTLALHALSLAQFEDGLAHVFLCGTGILQYPAHRRTDNQQCQQHRFARNILVAHLARQVFSFLKHLVSVVTQIRLAALYARQVLHFLLTEQLNLLGVDAQFLKNECSDITRLVHHRRHQVNGFYGLLAVALRQRDSLLHGLLRLNGKFV